jgi:poly(A) polymerase
VALAPPTATPLGGGANRIVVELRAAGFEAFWAGGCVRDLLVGRTPKDIDIATNARPEQVQALFPITHAVGRSFGVVLVECNGFTYEVATFRRDAAYSDGRRPDSVEFTTAEADAQRRDFTINGLFLDPINGELHDYVGGQADLERQVVRAIGDPLARFAEDHLRLMRAVRFASTLGFQLDPATAAAIRVQAGQLARISAERIQTELIRLLTESPKAGQAVELLDDTGLLSVILPEVAHLHGVEQPPNYHPEGDVYRHTVIMLDLMERPSPELALSVLLHDIGKPPTQRRVQQEGRERIRFDGHAEVGAQMAEALLLRLRCSRALTEHVVACVRGHMRFIDAAHMRTATLRRLVMAPTFPTELELHRLDCLGSNGNLENYHLVHACAEGLQHEPLRPAPLLRGGEVLRAGVPAGPLVGRVLQEAYDLQLEGKLTSEVQARQWLQEHLNAHPDLRTTPVPPERAGNSSP